MLKSVCDIVHNILLLSSTNAAAPTMSFTVRCSAAMSLFRVFHDPALPHPRSPPPFSLPRLSPCPAFLPHRKPLAVANQLMHQPWLQCAPLDAELCCCSQDIIYKRLFSGNVTLHSLVGSPPHPFHPHSAPLAVAKQLLHSPSITHQDTPASALWDLSRVLMQDAKAAVTAAAQAAAAAPADKADADKAQPAAGHAVPAAPAEGSAARGADGGSLSPGNTAMPFAYVSSDKVAPSNAVALAFVSSDQPRPYKSVTSCLHIQ